MQTRSRQKIMATISEMIRHTPDHSYLIGSTCRQPTRVPNDRSTDTKSEEQKVKAAH